MGARLYMNDTNHKCPRALSLFLALEADQACVNLSVLRLRRDVEGQSYSLTQSCHAERAPKGPRSIYRSAGLSTGFETDPSG